MEYHDLDGAFINCFPSDKQKEVYQQFGIGDHPQMSQFISAIMGSHKTFNTVLDYGAGCGSLIKGFLNHINSVKKDNVSSYICVNHELECLPETMQPINEYLEQQLNAVRNESPYYGINFQCLTDGQLVSAMYAGSPLFQADLAFCLNVLHHIPLYDLPSKLASLLFHLAPGGMLLVGDTCMPMFAETDRFWWNIDSDLPSVLLEPWLEVNCTQFKGRSSEMLFACVTRNLEQEIGDFQSFTDRLNQRCWELYERKAVELYLKMRVRNNQLIQAKKQHREPSAEELKCIYFTQISWRDTLRQMHKASTLQPKVRPTLTPGDCAIMLTFRRAINGQEMAVLDAATNVAGASSKALISLGQYDVVTLEEFSDLKDFHAAALTTHPIPNVFNTNSHACFTWKPYRDQYESNIPISLPLAELDGQLLGICFLKIHPAHLHAFGVHAETSLVLHIISQMNTYFTTEQQQSFKLSFLGSFGWCELVLLISAQDIETIAKVAAIVRDIECPLDPERHAGLLTSFTVLAVEKKHLHATGRTLGGIDLSISFTAHGGLKSQLRDQLAQEYGHPPFTVIGKVDFIGIRKPQEADVIDELLKLRQKPGVLFTTTQPLVDIMLKTQSSALPPLQDATWDIERAIDFYERIAILLVKVSESHEDALSKIIPPAMMLKQALCEYITCASDPLVRDTVLDLAANLFKVCEEALYLLPNPSSDMTNQDIIYTAAQSVLTALKQRYAGTYDTIYNSNDINTSGMSVGVHRLLGATSSVIASTLQRYLPSIPWSGYVVYGLNLQPFRDHYGKFNFPGERAFDLLSVDNLWYLHEIGHEFASHIKDDVMLPWLQPETENTEEAYDMLREIIADLFCFQIGFQEDSPLYLKTIRKYFNRLITVQSDNVSSLRMRYLLRLMAVQYYKTYNPTTFKARREYVSWDVSQLLSTLIERGYDLQHPSDPSQAIDLLFPGQGEQDKQVADWLEEYILTPFETVNHFTKEEMLQFTKRYSLLKNTWQHLNEQIKHALPSEEYSRILSEVDLSPTDTEMRIAQWLIDHLTRLSMQPNKEDNQAIQHFRDMQDALAWKREDKLLHLGDLVIRVWKQHIFTTLQQHALMGFPIELMDVQAVAKHIQEGNIVTVPLLSWERVVLALNQEAEETTIAQHLAMIMSLWHTWTRWQHPMLWEDLRCANSAVIADPTLVIADSTNTTAERSDA